MIIIVTGTNTDVGKTIATAALACQYRDAGYGVEVVKPAQTGDDSDIRDIEKLSGVAGREYAHYPEPLAPNIAARRAGMPQLELHATAERIRHLDADDTVVLVEGAGGLLVRMADTWTLADLAVELAAPLIVVTSTGLGSLNLAELTVMAARARAHRWIPANQPRPCHPAQPHRISRRYRSAASWLPPRKLWGLPA